MTSLTQRLAERDRCFAGAAGLVGAWWPVRGAEILADFHAGMHARINDATPYIERGRS